jgi:hypothetical protein
MRRWIAASASALLLVGLIATSSVDVFAADKTVTGTVTAVSPDSITIKDKDAETKLVVDAKTKVIGTGVGTKTEKMKDEKKSPQIVDFVKTGDTVTAKYDDATKHATEVRLTKPATK